ncbi:hypothetical protein [Seonamhaeicola marinus]|uniref:hypothetical protein n=1 Tax=Seonamhaeicola marinus TaxID=1912246 RepID=UPI001652983A|nr:hypothetical protein [Seonamhaeicola marinus]
MKAVIITKAKKISTLLSAKKTSFPMLSPISRVTPVALNFNQDSIKLIAPRKPIHINEAEIMILRDDLMLDVI